MDSTASKSSGPGTGLPPRLPDAATKLRRWWPWAAAGVLLVALGLLFGFNPARHVFYPQCFMYRATGLSCPGCGGLRAVHHLLHGDVLMAFRFNPVFIAALPVTAWLVGRRLLKRPPLAHRTVALLAWLSLAVLIAFGVLRNLLPGFFTLPAG